MTARPIIFSAPMVCALLAGRKTQTRRVVKPQPVGAWAAPGRTSCPYGQPGDLLWVRESWARRLDEDHLRAADIEPERRWAWYWADGPGKTCRTGCAGAAGRVRASLFMPRWASRLTLRLTAIRVERVQEISEADAEAEGVDAVSLEDVPRQAAWSRRHDYARLWDAINGSGSWNANPWVWALTFEVIRRNVDAILAEAGWGSWRSRRGPSCRSIREVNRLRAAIERKDRALRELCEACERAAPDGNPWGLPMLPEMERAHAALGNVGDKP